MGNYHITLQGVGPHANSPATPDDAELVAKEFIRELEERGHTVERAILTCSGGQDHILFPEPQAEEEETDPAPSPDESSSTGKSDDGSGSPPSGSSDTPPPDDKKE